MSADRAMLLVHGGWHGPWCWDPILPALSAGGVSPATVELPMQSLAGDADAVRQAMKELGDASALVVVGHSYAGQVISAAGHAADRLVYVAAIAPEADESILDSVGFGFGVVPGVEIEEETWATRLTAESLPSFYGNAGQEAQDWALPRLRRLAAGCIADALPGRPAWREVPSHYFVSTDDEMLPVGYQRACAAKIGRGTELVADHSPFASAPDDLVAALLQVASELG
jgi:pimeloyl-ACP methyl ester carboxylesterase